MKTTQMDCLADGSCEIIRHRFGHHEISFRIRLAASALDISRVIFIARELGYVSTNPVEDEILLKPLKELFKCPALPQPAKPLERSLPFCSITPTGASGPSGFITNHGRVRVGNETESVPFDVYQKNEELEYLRN